MKYTCPICGHLAFNEPPGSYDICLVCGWEDDLSQLRFPETSGANGDSLIEAQKMFLKRGYYKRSLGKMFSKEGASPSEVDPKWRPLAEEDQYEKIEIGKDYGDTYPEDLTQLYYWNK